jgi:hypothetical protein
MKKYQRKFLIALQVCSIGSLMMFAAPAHAKAAPAPRSAEQVIVPPAVPPQLHLDPTLFVPFFQGHGSARKTISASRQARRLLGSFCLPRRPLCSIKMVSS